MQPFMGLLRPIFCWYLVTMALISTIYADAIPPLPDDETYFAYTLPLPDPIVDEVEEAPQRLPQVIRNEAPPLNLATLEAMTLTDHPTVLTAVAEMQAARGTWLQSGLRPNPTIGYAGTEIGNERRAGFQGAYWQQTFVRGNKLQLNRAVASQEVAWREQAVISAELDVLTELRVAFYQLLVIQERHRVLSRLVEISHQAEQTAQQLVEAQEKPRTDHLQASIELARFRTDLQSTVIAKRKARRALEARAGQQQTDWQQVDGSVQPMPEPLEWQQTIDEILSTHPSIIMATSAVQRARYQLARERAEPIPNLQTQIMVQHDDSTDLVVPSVQAVWAIPWHNRNQGAIARAQADLRAAMQQLNERRLDLRREAADLFADYETAAQRVTAFETSILPKASETQQLITEAYRGQEIEFLVLLTAQRTFFQSTLAYLNALESLWTSRWRVLGMMPMQAIPRPQ